MRRTIAITLLALGTFLGYGAGLAHIAHRHHACSEWRNHDRAPSPHEDR